MKCLSFKVFVSVMVLCALVSGGCSTNKKGLEGGDTLSPQVLSGDIGLTERFEDGERVPASEFDPESVYFAYDSFRVNASENYKIAKVSAFLKSNRDVRLIVEGHCDERGSRDYNLSLGEHRALAIRAALVSDENIASERIQTRSYGEEMPVNSGHSESAWSKNRRGEFALYR